MTFHATVLTLFPAMFPGALGYSITGRALKEHVWSLETINIRDFGLGKHSQVDDTPYGGGAGMVMRADVVSAAIEEGMKRHPNAQLIYFTPKGEPLTQRFISKLCHSELVSESMEQKPLKHVQDDLNLLLLCGRFEAIDERVIEKYQPLEVSLGDFVMTGGELAAMALLDACIRLLPGVIGDAESLAQESFGLAEDYACLLEHPHYTRPPVWEGYSVPEMLLSGNHSGIEAWRKQQSELVTQARRPDMWKRYNEGNES